MGTLRGMGGHGAEIGDRWARWPRSFPPIDSRLILIFLQVRIWDPKTGKPFGEALKGHSKWITSLCWEPIHLFASSLFGSVYMLKTILRNPLAPRLASSSKDNTVRVWSLLTRRVEYTLGGHTASVNVVKWGGVGKGVLYTASSDRTVRVWDAEAVNLC